MTSFTRVSGLVLEHNVVSSLIVCANLNVSPGDRQDGAGPPRGGADGAQWAAGVDRLHGNHRVARQERSQVTLPDEGVDECHENMLPGPKFLKNVFLN